MQPAGTGPAFLFDLDGTLVDSVYQHVLAWREALELRCILGGHRSPGLAEKGIHEEPAAHSDAAMDAPDRQLDPRLFERLSPRQDVLVDAIHECAVEIEQEGRGRLQVAAR